MILILGSQGQLSESFRTLLTESREFSNFKVLGIEDIDFLKPEETIKKISEYQPRWVINAAAYTQVDKSEIEKEPCFQINTLTPIRIAKWCKEERVNFVHYSTDYVFNGSGETPWVESDPTDPINYYGQTKRASEEGIIQTECAHLIFRISWVYHYFGNNFVKTMLKLGSEREELKIVNDQIGYPCYAPDIAKATLECIRKHNESKVAPSELLHLSSNEHTNWFEFANKIFEKARAMGLPLKVKSVLPIKTSEYPTPAKRPLNSRLNADKALDLYGISLPHWEKSLETCLKHIISTKS